MFTKFNQLAITLFFVACLGNFHSAFAQEDTPAEDPFEDYSHLWEDPKAKAKEEKKRQREEKKRKKQLDKQGGESVAATDSLNNTEPSTPATGEEVVDQNNTQNATEPTEPTNVAPKRNERPAQSKPLPSSNTPASSANNSNTQSNNPAPSPTDVVPGAAGALVAEDFRAGLGGLDPTNYFSGGFTYTNIGGENFVGLTLSPEFKIGKVGVGLNVPILYGLDDQSFRTEIFKDGIGIGRLITYVRYGTQKVDPVYIKVGELNNTMIGYGSLVNNYTNSTSYEKRKVGIHYDINIKGVAGIEGMYSDFDPGSFNLFVIRPYVRPLGQSGIPIIKTFEIGSTYVSDKDQTDIPVTDDVSASYTFTKPGISAFGIDMGVTLLRVPFIQIDLFAAYSKLNVKSDVLNTTLTDLYNTTGAPTQLSDGFADGKGISAGVNFRMHFIANIFSTDIRIERLNYDEHYLPQFFDGAYEINKDAKILSLGSAQSMSGIYGSLTGHILQKIRLGGSLLIPDDISANAPAVVRLNADLPRLGNKISIHGSYIKGNLADLSDAFTFDENSLAKLRFIYHLNDFLVAGMDYFWAFSRVEDGTYKATKYVAPYFGLNIQF